MRYTGRFTGGRPGQVQAEGSLGANHLLLPPRLPLAGPEEHGLRHNYAQETVAAIQRQIPLAGAELVVSKALARFLPEIPVVCLRGPA